MNVVILKFGGTSVNDIEKRKRILEIVKDTIKNNELPIVVVSAMGRYPDNYATDTLISLVSKAYQDDKKSMDMLMSCGEIISINVISSYLKENGIDATALTGGQAGIITDDVFGNANIIKYNDKYIKKLLKDNKVPVVAGFQGITKNNFVTTLGRGGSDTTAAILGAYLNAKRIEIYTDVDGIMTNDPKLDNKAITIDEISLEDAYNMALNGAKVINSKALKYLFNKQIPLYIKNISNNKGTLIRCKKD